MDRNLQGWPKTRRHKTAALQNPVAPGGLLATLSGGFRSVFLTRVFPFHAGTALFLSWWLLGLNAALGQSTTGKNSPPPPAQILSLEGNVEVARAGAVDWDPAYTNQVLRPGDRGRTGPRSRATLRMSDLSVVPIGERSEFLIEAPPPKAKSSTIFTLLRGLAYFFHRGKPQDVEFKSKTAVAAIRGTEFNFAVDDQGRTTVTMFEGQVDLSSAGQTIHLVSGEQGVAEPGRPPRKTAVLDAINVIQWALYYPGVLDVRELGLSAAPGPALADSLAAYRTGDLLAALAHYPPDRQPASTAERIYLAALLLAVGQVTEAETLLEAIPARTPDQAEAPREARLANALRLVIAAVKHQPRPPALAAAPSPLTPRSSTKLATEWLAESYYLQSQSLLAEARDAARWATEQSPAFGFAWARVAELEFGFGRIKQARRDLANALAHTPRNAQALALQGFCLSADNRIREALTWFDRAIAVDAALGNAWLGRGLCRIQLGQAEAGREDLLVAAAREPQRAIYRSYLGKAFSQTGDNRRAAHELDLAKRLDPNDPTAWLYAALLNQQRNRINEAIRDLETSQRLNDNRRVYRSRLLLDQDRAIRGANLARIYQDAGLDAVAGREAARAVNADYANYSAHLFLAGSYNARRDPRQVNLRYETPWLSEYLVANLLAPVGAGILSPQVTQQEYSRLFEENRLGLVSSTEYFSNGDWRQNASQYGRYGNSAYSLDLSYRSENGQRVNNDLDQLSLSLRVKQQLSAKDTVYFQGLYYDAAGGDLAPVYDPTAPLTPAGPNSLLRFKERQEPLLLAGWHREWSPGNHSLVLAGRLTDEFEVRNPWQGSFLLTLDGAGQVGKVQELALDQEYHSDTTIWTAEWQQIHQRNQHTAVAGVRYQTGEFESDNRHDGILFGEPALNTNVLGSIVRQQVSGFGRRSVQSGFDRLSLYAYDHWQIADPLLLVAGVTYDWLRTPDNFRFAPLAEGEDTTHRVSPKAGLIWTPTGSTTVRAAYSQSLGGVSFDQSFQLEPSQVAGFNQAWRSLLPEAVGGANAQARFETAGLSLEQKFGRGTYLGVSGQWLRSKVGRDFGVYELDSGTGLFGTVNASAIRETLNYKERTLQATADQLIGNHWALGARYRVSVAELDLRRRLPAPGDAQYVGDARPREHWESVLHQVNLVGHYYLPCGFFSSAEAIWYKQSNQGYTPDRPGDNFWHVNLFAGYRFPRRQAELRLGVLNLTDRDYRLNPLNLLPYLPRGRTFAASFKFNF